MNGKTADDADRADILKENRLYPRFIFRLLLSGDYPVAVYWFRLAGLGNIALLNQEAVDAYE